MVPPAAAPADAPVVQTAACLRKHLSARCFSARAQRHFFTNRDVARGNETRAGRRTKAARGMAKASGVGRTTVRQIWRALGLPPHRSETFRLSNDPLLIEKVRDIVGLYMNPPEHAAPFCGERLKSRSCSQRLTACTSLRGAGEDPA